MSATCVWEIFRINDILVTNISDTLVMNMDTMSHRAVHLISVHDSFSENQRLFVKGTAFNMHSMKHNLPQQEGIITITVLPFRQKIMFSFSLCGDYNL